MATDTVVDLLRHGEVAGGARLRGARTDDGLTPRGWADLHEVARHAGPWDLVATSPLARCHAFAQALARAGCGELVVDARLREYDFGDWDGCALDALWAHHGDALAAFLGDPDRLTPPGGETAAAFRARVRAAWRDLLARAGRGRVLVVGHGGVLRQVVADALDLPAGGHATLEWPHAALTRLRVHDGVPHAPAVTLVFHAREYGSTA